MAYSVIDYGACGHACALLLNGTVSCWGSNNYGEVGYAGSPPMTPFPSPVPAPTPVVVPGVTKPIVSIASGDSMSCATDGTSGTGQVYCWGRNDYGQLGGGFTFDFVTPIPTPVIGIANGGQTVPAAGVTAESAHACAWLQDGTVRCWGSNDYGELGDGTFDDRATPVTVQGLTGVKLVIAGPHHNCALLTTGGVSCWGSSYFGQAGSGKSGAVATPTMVMNLP